MKKIILILLFLVVGSQQSIAQYNILPQNYDWSETTLMHDNTAQLKNPNTAMWMSVGSTIGTYILFAGLTSAESESTVLYTILSLSLLASPALGYLYTDNWNDFWSSVARRFIGRLVIGTGALIVLLESFDNWFDNDDSDDLLIAGGLALMLGGAIYNLSITFRDFRQVRTRVHEYNEGLIQSVQIMPAVDPVNKAIGVGFRVIFNPVDQYLRTKILNMDVKVDVNWLGEGMHFEAGNEEGGLIRIDGDRTVGGLDGGMSPMQMLLAGAAGCSAIDVISILKKQRQDLKSLTVDVTGDRVTLDAGYSEYKTIHMHFKLSGNLDEKKVARALGLSITKYCSVSKALEKTSDISYDFSISN